MSGFQVLPDTQSEAISSMFLQKSQPNPAKYAAPNDVASAVVRDPVYTYRHLDRYPSSIPSGSGRHILRTIQESST